MNIYSMLSLIMTKVMICLVDHCWLFLLLPRVRLHLACPISSTSHQSSPFVSDISRCFFFPWSLISSSSLNSWNVSERPVTPYVHWIMGLRAHLAGVKLPVFQDRCMIDFLETICEIFESRVKNPSHCIYGSVSVKGLSLVDRAFLFLRSLWKQHFQKIGS